ncbi:MAG: alpha/beta fold hydrolase [Erythrobacter sp.]
MVRLIAASLLVIASAFAVPNVYAQDGGADPQIAEVGQSGGLATEPEPEGSTERAAEPVAKPAAKKPEIPDLIPTANLAGHSIWREFDLSPDGKILAVERKDESLTQILLIDANTRDVIKSYSLAPRLSLDWMEWAGNGKLLVSLSRPTFFFGHQTRFSRIYVRNINSDEIFELEVSDEVLWGGDIVHIADDGNTALVSVQKDLTSNPSVYRYELKEGGSVERVIKHKFGVWSWYADEDGVVRLGMGWEKKRLRIYYRPDAGSKFKLVGKLKESDQASRYWSVYRIISGSDRGYVIEEGENGRMGVRLFDYSTGQPVSTFYENPDWDVDDLWLDEDGQPQAAIYTDDREQIVWFDKKSEDLHRQLTKALKMEDVQIIGRSEDSDRMLVWAGSEADPGALYIYTPDEKRLDLFANYRPDLDFRSLVKPKPMRYTARDGLVIRGYLTLPRGREAKGLPLIIMPHGGPYGVRDSLRYNDEVQLLANRGYAVLQPNFRGSGGYGEAFFEAGTGEVGRRMQDDLDDAMDWAVGEGIADPKRICVVGGSYGGYAALWSVLRNPERYRCAASWAGVTDWEEMLKYDRKYMTRKAGKAWQARIEGKEEFDLDSVSLVQRAGQLSRPTLLAHGTRDDNVPVSQYEAFLEAAKSAPVQPETLLIAGEGHSFSSAKNEQRWYDALDRFLAKHNPADQVDSNGELIVPASPEPPSIFTDIELPAASEAK